MRQLLAFVVIVTGALLAFHYALVDRLTQPWLGVSEVGLGILIGIAYAAWLRRARRRREDPGSRGPSRR